MTTGEPGRSGPSELERTAARLREAYRGGTIAPLRDALDPGDVEAAYAIQAINRRHWEAGGRRAIGWKIGLTSKAVQQQLGVDQPDFGVLFEDMAIANGGALPADRLLQPKAEAEIAFVIGRDLPPRPVDRDEMADHVGSVVPAIEIVDSRIDDWKITIADTIADNGSSGLFVLGDERLPLAGLDLWSCGMVLERNGEIASIGAGAACLGHPLDAAIWLADSLAARGAPLREGDILLTGALGPMVPIAPGDRVRVTIGGIGTVHFG